jgi:mono/diheme cytochrome c family protein
VGSFLSVVYALGLVAAFLVLQASLSTAAAVLPSEVAAADQRSAATLYSKHCATCHGKDGRSKTLKAKLNHARNLTEPGWQEAVSDERIFNSIANGRGSKMPAFAKKMTEAEIDSLVSLVRGMKRE